MQSSNGRSCSHLQRCCRHFLDFSRASASSWRCSASNTFWSCRPCSWRSRSSSSPSPLPLARICKTSVTLGSWRRSNQRVLRCRSGLTLISGSFTGSCCRRCCRPGWACTPSSPSPRASTLPRSKWTWVSSSTSTTSSQRLDYPIWPPVLLAGSRARTSSRRPSLLTELEPTRAPAASWSSQWSSSSFSRHFRSSLTSQSSSSAPCSPSSPRT
mmetsp:Transcript_26870/g.59049  ORF Transcript_26870/g.59049 Transcript_26870/m.59049 type:complete len:213 (-) Transcript_26870:798-1436(-)